MCKSEAYFIFRVNSNCSNCLEFKFRPKKIFFSGRAVSSLTLFRITENDANKKQTVSWFYYCSVIQLCLTLCDPVDCSLPGSSVRGIIQARILEWIAISFSMVLL